MINPLFHIENISMNIMETERPLLENITYTIYPGDFIVILGGNGSGKSSLIKALNQTYVPTQGTLVFRDRPLTSWKGAAFSQALMTLTQKTEESLFLGLTVLENCLMTELRRHPVSLKRRQDQERIFYDAYLKSFNPALSLKLDQRVGALSGGEKQSLLLGLCLRYPPQLLLLDEHTSALDPKTAEIIMTHTEEEIKKHHITCVMTTHNLEDALRYGNRLLALKEGRIIYQADYGQKHSLDRETLLHACY